MEGIKRKPISLAEKLEIIKKVDSRKNVTRVQIAAELNIPVSTLNTIMANRQKLLEKSVTEQSSRKKLKTGKYEQVEVVLLEWFRQKRALNLPIDGNILRKKAVDIALKLNIDFKPSNGWLYRFKKCAGLTYRKVCGEERSVNMEEVDVWRETSLSRLIADYSPKDIFNADEFGLFYNVIPDKTYAFKGDGCKGIKVQKDRITALVCSNMDGTEKLPLLVIGKAGKPRCFKNIKTLPCTYKHNNTAWMTSKIFTEYLIALDRRMASKNRKIILFLDQCPAHPKVLPELKNLKVEFFPANATSVLQPMDQGVIKNIKHKFRHSLVLRLLQRIQSPENMYKLSLLEAMSMLAMSWDSVKQETIANCFRKAGFPSDSAKILEEIEESCDIWPTVQEKFSIDTSFQDFVKADDFLEPCPELELDDLCIAMVPAESVDTIDDVHSDEGKPVPTCSEAIDLLDKFGRFLYSNTDVPEML
uniref:CENP-B-like protein 1 n=1 Tax=Locusta migratoria TaxID=7004 RepID=A0A2H4EWE8_LOCMI|nr:CENP-B-like protein 1 [Locusta migratoria]